MSGSSSSVSSPDAGSGLAAVVVAAGAGRRMDGEGGAPKQYMQLLGTPVLAWSVRAFTEHPAVGCTVVVLPPEDAALPPGWLRDLPVRLTAGGAERGDSVRNGLAAVPDGYDRVLIHDAARPLVPRAVVDRVIASIEDAGAIAALPMADTVKEIDAGGTISRTIDRSRLWTAQTPQGFRLDLIRRVHEAARAEGITSTDDAALCEWYGLAVRVVHGAAENMKITRPGDLEIVEALARGLRGHAALPLPPEPGA